MPAGCKRGGTKQHVSGGQQAHVLTWMLDDLIGEPFCPLLVCFLQAMRLTMVQVLINSKGLAMNPLQSLYYVSPACLVCLLPPFCECAFERTQCPGSWVLAIP